MLLYAHLVYDKRAYYIVCGHIKKNKGGTVHVLFTFCSLVPALFSVCSLFVLLDSALFTICSFRFKQENEPRT